MTQGVSLLQRGGPVLTGLPDSIMLYLQRQRLLRKQVLKAMAEDGAAQWRMGAACPYGALKAGPGRGHRVPAGH